MAEAITIDNYDVSAHKRWAVDQAGLDRSLIQDAECIPAHLNAAVMHSKISSKWEELFEFPFNKHPFATFSPPPNYLMTRNRFFSYALSPDFQWVDPDEDDEDQEREEKRQIETYKNKIRAKKSKHIPLALFEKDRSHLLSLLDSIQALNGLLRDAHAKKLQYQKG